MRPERGFEMRLDEVELTAPTRFDQLSPGRATRATRATQLQLIAWADEAGLNDGREDERFGGSPNVWPVTENPAMLTVSDAITPVAVPDPYVMEKAWFVLLYVDDDEVVKRLMLWQVDEEHCESATHLRGESAKPRSKRDGRTSVEGEGQSWEPRTGRQSPCRG
jgi:hypothetical protein